MRNKLPVAQCNEVLAKVLLHNLACVVHAVEKQGALLLDCAEVLNVHVAAYEYRLLELRRHSGGRAPSVAHDYLAAEQHRFGLDDERVTQSLVDVGFIPGRETFVAQFRENVIKKHRLRWLKRQRNE